MNSLTNENTRLGFIGIGNMGSRIARRLLERGYRLIAYNRRREAADALVKYGARSGNAGDRGVGCLWPKGRAGSSSTARGLVTYSGDCTCASRSSAKAPSKISRP